MILKNTSKAGTISVSNSEKFFNYRVCRCEPITRDVIELILTPATSNRLMPLAGQYCNIRCHDGVFRPYSIATYLPNCGTICLHVRLTSFNSAYFTSLCRQDIINLSGPYGDGIHYKPKVPMLLVCEGTGIAAYNQWMFQDTTHKIDAHCRLLWSGKEDDVQYYRKLCSSWSGTISSIMIVSDKKSWDAVIKNCNAFSKKLNRYSVYFAGSPALKAHVLERFVMPETHLGKIVEFNSDI